MQGGTGDIKMKEDSTYSQGVCWLSIFMHGSHQLLMLKYFFDIYSREKVQGWLEMVSLISLSSFVALTFYFMLIYLQSSSYFRLSLHYRM